MVQPPAVNPKLVPSFALPHVSALTKIRRFSSCSWARFIAISLRFERWTNLLPLVKTVNIPAIVVAIITAETIISINVNPERLTYSFCIAD